MSLAYTPQYQWKVIAWCRLSANRGAADGLVFAFNLEPRQAHTTLRPKWNTNHAHDLLAQRDLPITDCAFQLVIEPWEVAIIHCAET